MLETRIEDGLKERIEKERPFLLVADELYEWDYIKERKQFDVVLDEGQKAGDLLWLMRKEEGTLNIYETNYLYEITYVERKCRLVKQGWCIIGFKLLPIRYVPSIEIKNSIKERKLSDFIGEQNIE